MSPGVVSTTLVYVVYLSEIEESIHYTFGSRSCISPAVLSSSEVHQTRSRDQCLASL